MDDTTVDPLETFVCEVVQPVNASEGRKKRMYEELSAHLREAYETRIESGDDEASAIDHALARFGDAGKLRNELQTEVPRAERVLHTPLGRRRPGESDLHYIVRSTVFAMIFLALCLACVASIEHILTGKIFSDWRVVGGAMKFFAVMSPFFAAFFFITFSIDVLRYRLIREGNLRKANRYAWLDSGLWSAMILGATGGVLYFAPALREQWIHYVLGTLAVSALIGFGNLVETREHAKKRPWSRTRIGF